MPSESKLKESLHAVIKNRRFSLSEEELSRRFLSLARIAPNCMADPDIAGGFMAAVLKAGGDLGPAIIADIVNAEKLLKDLKIQPLGIDDSLSLTEQLDLFEKHLIERALQQYRKKGDVAKALGIPQSTLSTKLKRYGLN